MVDSSADARREGVPTAHPFPVERAAAEVETAYGVTTFLDVVHRGQRLDIATYPRVTTLRGVIHNGRSRHLHSVKCAKPPRVTTLARQRIVKLTAVLMQRGSLSAEEIYQLAT
jgi:hypothetical protein